MKQQITFRDLHHEDRINFYDWINDEIAVKYSLSVFQTISTEDEIDRWFQELLDDKKSFNRAILYNNKLIGYAGISSISRINNYGEYFIFIGDKQAWGAGAGSYVTKEIVSIGFNKLLLNRISLTVSDQNIYAIRAYKSAGFIEEGRMRQACFRDGYYHDKIMMSMIRDDIS